MSVFRNILHQINLAIYGSIPFFECLFQKIRIDTSACLNVSFEPLRGDNKQVDLIVVAFNNLRFIEEQARLVKKFITDDDFSYIVVDNSTDTKARKSIRQFCENEGLGYIPIPRYTRFLNFAKRCISHAIALNLAYNQFIITRKPFTFGVLDHDIFPLKPFSIIDKLREQPFYGIMRDRRINESKGGWYLWPGYAFYKLEAIYNKTINFQPLIVDGVFLDTGGTNYARLYSPYDPNRMQFASEKVVRVRQSDGITSRSDTFLTDCVNMIDSETWVHLINGSNTANIPFKTDKQKMIASFMERIKAKTE